MAAFLAREPGAALPFKDSEVPLLSLLMQEGRHRGCNHRQYVDSLAVPSLAT